MLLLPLLLLLLFVSLQSVTEGKRTERNGGGPSQTTTPAPETPILEEDGAGERRVGIISSTVSSSRTHRDSIRSTVSTTGTSSQGAGAGETERLQGNGMVTHSPSTVSGTDRSRGPAEADPATAQLTGQEVAADVSASSPTADSMGSNLSRPLDKSHRTAPVTSSSSSISKLAANLEPTLAQPANDLSAKSQPSTASRKASGARHRASFHRPAGRSELSSRKERSSGDEDDEVRSMSSDRPWGGVHRRLHPRQRPRCLPGATHQGSRVQGETQAAEAGPRPTSPPPARGRGSVPVRVRIGSQGRQIWIQTRIQSVQWPISIFGRIAEQGLDGRVHKECFHGEKGGEEAQCGEEEYE